MKGPGFLGLWVVGRVVFLGVLMSRLVFGFDILQVVGSWVGQEYHH